MDELREPINLSPEVATRGAVVTTASIGEFVVFGYSHGHNDWVSASTTATSDLMFNNKYTKTGNAWTGEAKTQWPDNEFKRYSFFAYSPAAATANKITLLTSRSTVGYQKLRYETLADVGTQVDLVLASRLNQTPVRAVPLSFGHSLARVGFCAYAEKTGVTVKSISINGVKYKGEIEVRKDADWSNVSTDKASFTATINSGVISTDMNNPTNLTGANGEYYFMLLPQDLTGNADNTTCITVVTTKDGEDRSMSYTITHNYQKGKSLLYKLFISGGVDLVVDYTVTDWTTSNIPTDIKTTYLNVTSLSEASPATFFYATDYAGTVKVEEVGTTGKLAITHDAVKKSFTVNLTTGGLYKVQVTAGNLSRTVAVSFPLSVAPASQLAVPHNTTSYTVKVSSLSAWSATTSWSNVTITPSSGEAGVDVSVVITLGANVSRSARNVAIVFTTTDGGVTKTTSWTGSQIANPDYYVGRFAGEVVTQTIDANTTRCFFSKQLFAASADWASLLRWGDVTGSTGAQSLFDGKSNTAKLNTLNYPAAYTCLTASGGTWYLPAQNQLLALWIAKPVLVSVSGSSYWSSTENNLDGGRVFKMTDGTLTFDLRSNANSVRCVREEPLAQTIK